MYHCQIREKMSLTFSAVNFFVFQYYFFTFCPTLNLKIKSLVNTMFRHWSLKESYVKAVGTGLNLDLRTIEFKLFSNPEPGSCIFDTQVSGYNSSHQFWSCIWSGKLLILILYLEPETFGLILIIPIAWTRYFRGHFEFYAEYA